MHLYRIRFAPISHQPAWCIRMKWPSAEILLFDAAAHKRWFIVLGQERKWAAFRCEVWMTCFGWVADHKAINMLRKMMTGLFETDKDMFKQFWCYDDGVRLVYGWAICRLTLCVLRAVFGFRDKRWAVVWTYEISSPRTRVVYHFIGWYENLRR